MAMQENVLDMDQQAYKIRLSDGREFGPAPMELLVQWAREGRVPPDALLVNAATGDVKSVLADPALRSVVQAPPTISSGVAIAEGGAASVLIPTKNPAALTGYYLAVFSLIAGPLLSIPALVLGIIGMRKRARNPQVHGLAHAWVAIILGGLITLGWALLVIAIFMNI
jgi:hypothetical protein